jgi:NDP-sugar pyrophosphorylase family protein
MKAMVLAAGLGTRLRPLTDDRPKALVEVAGRTMLEITLERLRSFGIDEVIVNAHHHAQRLVDYLAAHQNFGMRIEISHEEQLLDTGGGLKRAAEFFLRGGEDEPFLVHNVDVLSTIDLPAMARQHAASDALATLAVKPRQSSRQLLFDQAGLLCGRRAGDATEWARETTDAEPLAFCGIHVISPRVFSLMDEQGAFSIVPVYLRQAAAGEPIAAYRADASYWRDLGRVESIRQAEDDIAAGLCR